MNFKEKIKSIFASIINSYSQIFFSEDKVLGVIILFVSFLDFGAGICGILAVVVSNSAALFLGYNRISTKKGLYGFNSLLMGLGVGLNFDICAELFVIVFFAALLTFFITIAMEGVFAKYAIPYLSLPFLFGIWTIVLATGSFHSIGLSERGLYKYNELYATGGQPLIDMYNWIENIEGYESLKIYFTSLGAIFFQHSIIAGVLIAVGLLYYSRIAFSLSLIGFYSAYYFYLILGSDFSELSYTFVGFNYILTSIAIGAYFIIPSSKSYFWVILLLPITVIVTASLQKFFSVWYFPIYSLPFNLIVILFIYILKLRYVKSRDLDDSFIRQSSPEKNLYLNRTNRERFKNQHFISIQLPFWGEWHVAQAHNGKYTHKEAWRHAWDFIIKDNQGSQYKNTGEALEDYYCYNKAITAPADGIIYDIADGIEDNKIGEVNIVQNWGNSIVIQHVEYLYSQLSHIKAGTINVQKGQYVKKGQVLAMVGNSGHSPYPHLHFQLQATPYIGSQTIDYPINNFLIVQKTETRYKTFYNPQLDDVVQPVQPEDIIKNAFRFIPGKHIEVERTIADKKEKFEWIVLKDIYNQTYIYCKSTKSSAYFYLDENAFFFQNFYGKRKSALFEFFISLYHVKPVFHQNIEINDAIRPNLFFTKISMFIQDFIAPFYVFLKTSFRLNYIEKDDDFSPNFIKISSTVKKKVFNKKIKTINSNIKLHKNETIEIEIISSGKTTYLKAEKIKRPENLI